MVNGLPSMVAEDLDDQEVKLSMYIEAAGMMIVSYQGTGVIVAQVVPHPQGQSPGQ